MDEVLDLKKTFLDHKVQQVTLVSKNNRPVGLSSSDVIALKRYDNRNQHVNNEYYASHSVSVFFSRLHLCMIRGVDLGIFLNI